MSPAHPIPYSMLNKKTAKKVIHYRIRQAGVTHLLVLPGHSALPVKNFY